MAGGRSERMRATNGPTHKALVEVDGVSLIERNLRSLFSSGVLDVVVVLSKNEPMITEYLKVRGSSLAERSGAHVQTFVESTPLGNIGAVAELNDGSTDLVVVYVDNITSIDVRKLLVRHREATAALTIATHSYALQNPFGELQLNNGYVISYREKPTHRFRISSGTCVVAPEAARLAPRHRSFGAAELFARVSENGLKTAAYEHDELWIDGNDASALREANALVRSAPERFNW